jgi:hypothetical protein
MSEERKGVFTPEQEKTLDSFIKLSGAAEKVDGIAITLIDNQLIERLKASAEEKNPGVTEEFIYPIVDAVMEGISKLVEEEE